MEPQKNINPGKSKFSQKTDIPIECVTFASAGNIGLNLLIRYMYYRSFESRLTMDPEMAIGQDYLRWYCDTKKDKFDFVVCDGVGQSFLGYIASEFLGDRLFAWLQSEGKDLVTLAAKGEREGFDETITAAIRSWKGEAKVRVRDAQLPQSLSPMVRTALESMQAYGSETVFVCGHLGLEGGVPYLIVFWMGDVRFRLFDRAGKEIETGANWTNAERWSTNYGMKGRSMPHCKAYNLQELNVGRFMAYSDGLSNIEAQIRNLSSADLQYKANQLLVTPSSDDISLVDILFSHNVNSFPFDPALVEKFSQVPPPPIFNEKLKIHAPSTAGRVLSWDKVEDAEQYVLLEKTPELPWHEIYRSTAPTDFLIRNRGAGQYVYEMRAIFVGAVEHKGPEYLLVLDDTKKEKGNPGTDPSDSRNVPPSTKMAPSWRSSAIDDAARNSRSIPTNLEKPILKVTTDFSSKTVLISWQAIQGAEDYLVSIREKNSITPFVSENTTEISYKWELGTWAGNYDIRVGARKAPNLPIYSDIKPISLELPKPPFPVIKLLPLPLKIGESILLTCISSGKPYSNTCKYQWQQSENSKMRSSRVFSDITSDHFEQSFDKSGVYYYQVRVYQDEVWSDWSQPSEIKVDANLEAPTIKYPLNNSVFYGDFILQWSDVNGAEKYLVEYADSYMLIWFPYKKDTPKKEGQIWKCLIKKNEPGTYRIRVKARDKSHNYAISDETMITISNKSSQPVAIPKPVSEFIKINNIECDPIKKQVTVFLENSTKWMQPKVFFYTSKDLNSFLHRYDVDYQNICSFFVPGPGKYYVCALDVFGKGSTGDKPSTNLGLVEFKMPLRKPNWNNVISFSDGQRPDTVTFKLDWYEVDNAKTYRLFLNKYEINQSIDWSGSLKSTQLELSLGWNEIQIQACNETLDVESEYRIMNFLVERKGNKLIITDHKEK